MSEHACEWCGTGTDGKKATCGSAHRGARWRWLKGIGNDAPPWPGSPLHGRYGENGRPAAAPISPAGANHADAAELRRVQRERNAATGRAERALRRAEDAEATAAAVLARRNGTRQGRQARSGVMLSYAKTREALFQRLSHFPGGERLIDEALRDALAPTQRRKLEARDAG